MKHLFFTLILVSATFSTQAQCVDTSNVHTFYFNNHTYEIVLENLNWIDAAACAVERNSYLVEINSQEEQDTIYNAIVSLGIDPSETVAPDGGGASYLWIGANDMATNNRWIWDGDNDGQGTHFWEGNWEGSPVDELYNNWGDEPDSQDAAAIGITSWPFGTPGQWNDVFSTNTLYYIIEKDTIIDTDTTMVTAIHETQTQELVNIYPNPTANYFSIDRDDVQSVVIYNNKGQLCQVVHSDFKRIDVSLLTKGNYQLSIRLTNNQLITKKLLKQ